MCVEQVPTLPSETSQSEQDYYSVLKDQFKDVTVVVAPAVRCSSSQVCNEAGDLSAINHCNRNQQEIRA